MSQLRVGSARGVITPPAGTPLGGNARRNNYATGVFQDLYARALYLESADTAACIISLDLLGLLESDAWKLRRAAAEVLAIPAENVMVACTHTHSGPDMMQMLSWSDEKTRHDQALIAAVKERILEEVKKAARRARERACPATMRVRLAFNYELPHNRRLRMRSGQTVMNWELPPVETVECPQGPVDSQVTLTSFHGQDDRLCGAIVHFTCHPAILAGLNLEISGDYSGFAMERLEKLYAPDAETSFLFLNGATGNINHIDYKRPEQGRDAREVERCAGLLIDSVKAAMESPCAAEPSACGDSQDGNVALRVSACELLMPFREFDPEELEAARELLSRYDGRDLSMADGVPPEVNARKLLRFEHARQSGEFPGPFTSMREGKLVLPLQLISVGPLTLGGVPSEIFAEYGLRFKQRLATPTALLVETCNGYTGYIPTPESFAQGGYEPSNGPSYLPPEAGERILEELIKMAKEKA